MVGGWPASSNLISYGQFRRPSNVVLNEIVMQDIGTFCRVSICLELYKQCVPGRVNKFPMAVSIYTVLIIESSNKPMICFA